MNKKYFLKGYMSKEAKEVIKEGRVDNITTGDMTAPMIKDLMKGDYTPEIEPKINEDGSTTYKEEAE